MAAPAQRDDTSSGINSRGSSQSVGRSRAVNLVPTFKGVETCGIWPEGGERINYVDILNSFEGAD